LGRLCFYALGLGQGATLVHVDHHPAALSGLISGSGPNEVGLEGSGPERFERRRPQHFGARVEPTRSEHHVDFAGREGAVQAGFDGRAQRAHCDFRVAVFTQRDEVLVRRQWAARGSLGALDFRTHGRKKVAHVAEPF
jgi:hypothetical protein